MSDINRIGESVALMYDTFGKPQPSQRVAEVWVRLLSKYPQDKIKSAFNDFLETRGEMERIEPSAIIRRLVPSKEQKEAKALEAWGLVLTANPYETNAFSDKAIHFALERIGGLHGILSCNMESFEFGQMRRDFTKLYLIYENEDVKECFTGITDAQNISNGYKVKKEIAMIMLGLNESEKKILSELHKKI